MIEANRRFISAHVGDGWLNINRLATWRGHNADMRSAASARGLTVERHGKLMLFFNDESCVGSQVGMVTSMVSTAAVVVAKDKALTKRVLRQSGVPVPGGKSYKPSDTDGAAELIHSGDRPWVVKPSDARAGMGITTEVRSEEDLKSAWKKARAALSKSDSRILVEEQIEGVDLRVFVVNGRAVSAATRVPAFVVGDGRRSVRDLVEHLDAARKTNAYIRSKRLSIDETMLARQKVSSLYDIPPEGSVILLSDKANIHRGGVSVEVTDAADERLLRLAEQACSAVPGLRVAGVDLLVPDIRQAGGARVVEMNTSANSAINQYPAFGAGRNVTGELVEAMLEQFRQRPE